MAGRLGQVGLAVALAGLLVACGSSGAAPTTSNGGGATATPGATASQGGGGGGGGGSGDTCSLLTAAQVSAAIGQSVGPGDSGGDPHECDFAHLNGNGLPDIQVIVNSNEDTGLCDKGSNAALGITITPVSGVGDKACISTINGLPSVLTFYKGGGRGWSVSASGNGVDAAKAAGIDTELAKDIAANV
jgi:hypothetical protein